MLPHWARVDLGAMAMKGAPYPQSPSITETSEILEIRLNGLKLYIAQSDGTLEYNDCFTAEG